MMRHEAVPVPESAPFQNGSPLPRIVIEAASPADREEIYRFRHEVYARELGQHSLNATERLRDSLDDWNLYLVAKAGPEIAGFISLTPPASPDQPGRASGIVSVVGSLSRRAARRPLTS